MDKMPRVNEIEIREIERRVWKRRKEVRRQGYEYTNDEANDSSRYICDFGSRYTKAELRSLINLDSTVSECRLDERRYWRFPFGDSLENAWQDFIASLQEDSGA